MGNTLKNKTLYTNNESTGSNGTLKFNGDTTGTYKPNGAPPTDIIWGEVWVNNHCALWVLFKESIDRNNIQIWGIELAANGDSISGTGISAFGNASPINPDDTTYVNDKYTFSSTQN